MEAGGTVSFTTMNDDGFQLVLGGTAIATTVGDGSHEDTIFAGRTSNTTVNGGGDQAVSHHELPPPARL